VLAISISSIMVKTDSFKEKESTGLVHKTAKKVSMIVVYLGD
jgi:hypothetical protein